MTLEILQEIDPHLEGWKIMKELNLLKANTEILYRPFYTLSGGEQVKVLLSFLFAKENHFLLMDEPTNHLDYEARKTIAEYLSKKKGFILISHDRELLDKVIDHVLAINKHKIELIQRNYSIWKENRDRQNHFEMKQNEKLQDEIKKLDNASKEKTGWSNQVEKTKYGTYNSGLRPDNGYIGHKSAKIMKQAKVLEKTKEIEKEDSLTIKPLEYEKKTLIFLNQVSIFYQDKMVCKNLNLEINQGDRIAIIGKNGSGKSSILKLILGEEISYQGEFKKGNQLIISYVPQLTDTLNGSLSDFAKDFKIDEAICKAMLSKLEVSNKEFLQPMQNLSQGQKKKIYLAKSITESAHLYLWDEPLNFVDIPSRLQ